MTNETDYIPCRYNGNGITKDFSFNWKADKATDLIVKLIDSENTEETLTLDVDYTVLINENTGNIKLINAPQTGETIVIERNTPQYQSSKYSTSPGFQGSELERSFDKVSLNLQEMQHNIDTFKTDFSNEINQEISDFEQETNQKITDLTNDVAEQIESLETETNEQISDFKDEVNTKIQEVSDAAEKINELEEAVEDAQQSALQAQNKAAEAATQAGLAQQAAQAAEEAANEASETVESKADISFSNINDAAKEVIRETAGTDYQLFDIIAKDHILTEDESLGLALLGTYVNKSVYPDFYNTCVSEKTAGTPTQTTLGDNIITTYNNPNGHIFYDIADKADIDAYYNSTGVAWFYGVDTTNERIFLPRNDWFFQSGAAADVGKFNEAGLPNITGSFREAGNSKITSGVFYQKQQYGGWTNGGTGGYTQDIAMDASLASSIYGNSDTVQPNAVKTVIYMVVGNTVINSDQALIDAQGLISDAWEEVDEKVNDGLAALAGASNALTQNQITNCITKIPQRINVELNNGALTLKAGSVVIVPYGTSAPTMEIGDSLNGGEIVDISWDGIRLFYFVKRLTDDVRTSIGAATADAFMFIAPSGGVYGEILNDLYSGDTAPTGIAESVMWYDTATNFVKYTINTGSSWDSGYSFPMFVVTRTTGGIITGIKQVFNGFGFIGSTIWADKGIKGLAPDGRNPDGSLKNIEFETEHVTINSRNWTVSAGTIQYATITAEGTGISTWISTFYYEQDEVPSRQGHILWLNTAENIMYWQNNDNVWTKVNIIKVFNINNTQTYTDGKIDNISEVKQVFRAADYSSHPQITETYSNGSSWYRVYSDGWCEQGGTYTTTTTTSNVYLLRPYKNNYYTVLGMDTGSARVSYGVRPNSTNSFILYSAATNNGIRWVAYGYLN